MLITWLTCMVYPLAAMCVYESVLISVVCMLLKIHYYFILSMKFMLIWMQTKSFVRFVSSIFLFSVFFWWDGGSLFLTHLHEELWVCVMISARPSDVMDMGKSLSVPSLLDIVNVISVKVHRVVYVCTNLTTFSDFDFLEKSFASYSCNSVLYYLQSSSNCWLWVWMDCTMHVILFNFCMHSRDTSCFMKTFMLTLFRRRWSEIF